MTYDQMRAVLRKQYNGAPKWVAKVDKMSTNQVIAVYKRMQGSGQLKN